MIEKFIEIDKSSFKSEFYVHIEIYGLNLNHDEILLMIYNAGLILKYCSNIQNKLNFRF
jgi:hypothetical protein